MEYPTGTATIEFARMGLVVVRFGPKVTLSKAAIKEVMRTRRGSTGGACSAIVVIPEHTAYDADLLTVDHYVANGLAHRTEALAIVCEELGLIPTLRLYFAFFPPPFAVGFCTSVDEARTWMRQRVALGAVV